MAPKSQVYQKYFNNNTTSLLVHNYVNSRFGTRKLILIGYSWSVGPSHCDSICEPVSFKVSFYKIKKNKTKLRWFELIIFNPNEVDDHSETFTDQSRGII